MGLFGRGKMMVRAHKMQPTSQQELAHDNHVPISKKSKVDIKLVETWHYAYVIEV